MGQAERVRILDPDPGWSDAFERVGMGLREILGGGAIRIDHIGSTSVPGLSAKDVIDVQVTVADDPMLDAVPALLEESGWTLFPDYRRDHQVPGASEAGEQWRKAFLREPSGERRVNLHVRVDGRANQRYALLFRDYLRQHPASAAAYGNFKRGLAKVAPSLDSYPDLKDPACDLIYLAAEEWAAATGWSPGASDA